MIMQTRMWDRLCFICRETFDKVELTNNKCVSCIERGKKYRHGLTIGEFDKLPKMCQICGSKRKLVIDHDHNCCPTISCGKCVRGVLCSRCNTMLGFALDSVTRLENAIGYLNARSASTLD